MSRDSKITLFWFLFALGMAVSLTNLFAPVHELGHVMYGLYIDGEGSFKDWNHSNVPMNLSHAIAGWHFEVGAFVLAGGFFGIVAGNNTQWLGAFFIGHAVTAMGRAYFSSDMNWYVQEVCTRLGLDRFATQDIILKIQGKWTVLALFWFAVSLAIIIRWHRKGLR